MKTVREEMRAQEANGDRILMAIERIARSKMNIHIKLEAINLLSWPGWEAGLLDKEVMKILEQPTRKAFVKLNDLFHELVEQSVSLRKS